MLYIINILINVNNICFRFCSNYFCTTAITPLTSGNMRLVSPVIFKPLDLKPIVGGELHWVSITSTDEIIPPNAVVGGFENGEVLYVARAMHNRSLCPGKYVPSSKHAFVAWGHRAHKKERFEILCGYNLKWVKTRSDVLPSHAFPGGTALETNNEDLYIGRAVVGETNLIPGKVHRHYKTCYIPYEEAEKEVYEYEILVTPGQIPQQRSLHIRHSDPHHDWH